MQYANFGFALGFFLIPLVMPLNILADECFPEHTTTTPERMYPDQETYIPDSSTSEPLRLTNQWILTEFLGHFDSYERPSRDQFRGYRRLTSKNILENTTRRKVFELICQNPGVSLSRLSQLSECNESTLRYHLEQMTHEKCITRFDQGRSSHYFKNHGGFSTREKQYLLCLSSGNARKIIRYIQENPGITRKELADKLEVASPTVTRAVRHLAQNGCILLEKEGRVTRHFIPEKSRIVVQNQDQ